MTHPYLLNEGESSEPPSKTLTSRSPFDNPIGHDPKPELRTRSVTATTPLYVINGTLHQEGQKLPIPLGVVRLPTTAQRLIQEKGLHCPPQSKPFFEVEAIQVGEVWYAPFSAFVIQPSTEEDLAEQQRLAKRELVLEKIKQSGLSEEELELLRN